MTIYTHSGPFHADDVLAVASLLLVWPDTEVVRTRKPEKLALALDEDFVIDVGGEYDNWRRRYDHHFPNAPRRDNGVPYASFGLVWKWWSDAIMPAVFQQAPWAQRLLEQANRNRVFDRFDRQFVLPIDAADCGFTLVENPASVLPGVSSLSLSAAVSQFNVPSDLPCAAVDAAFHRAVAAVTPFLLAGIWATADYVIRQDCVLTQLEQADLTRRFVVLDQPGPWQELVCSDSRYEYLLYVVFESNGQWLCQAVPDALGSFGKRKPLPEAWAGLRDEQFAAVSQVADGIFCHPGQFICGARSRDGAMRLAAAAVAS